MVFAMVVGMLLGDAPLVGGPIKHFFASLHLTSRHAAQLAGFAKNVMKPQNLD